MINNLKKYIRFIFITLGCLTKGNEFALEEKNISIKHRYIALFVILLIAVIALSIFVIFHPFGLIKGISDILSQKDFLGKMWISLMMIVMIAIGTYLFLCTIYLTCKAIIEIFGDENLTNKAKK